MKDPRLHDGMVVRQSSEPVAVEVDRSVVMMSIAREKYYSLGGVGGRIWEMVREPRSIGELCDRLAEEFDVDAALCRSDVEEFLLELLQEGLIEVAGETAEPVRPTSAS